MYSLAFALKNLKSFTLIVLMSGFLFVGFNSAKAQNEPPTLVDKLIREARQLESVDIHQAIRTLLKQEKEVKRLSSVAQQAAYYNKLSELNATIGQLNAQQRYAEQGLELLGEETMAIAADLNYNLGLVFEMKAEYNTAMAKYRKGLKIAQSTGHLLYQGRGKLFIAAIQSVQGDHDVALQTMQEAYGFAQQLDNDDFSWEVNNEMGLLYSTLKDDKLALEFGLKALKNSQNLNIDSLQSAALYNVAFYYKILKEYDNANIYFEKMLALSKSSGDRSDRYYAYKGFAMVASESGQHERALAYIDKAAQYLDAVQVVKGKSHFYIVKAKILNQLEQTNKALNQLNIAEQLLPRDQRNVQSQAGLNILKLKSSFHGELGQYRRAYELLREHAKGEEKFRRKHNEAAVRRLRVSFDVERNEARNEMLEKDNEIKALELQRAEDERHIQTFFIIALILLSVGLVVAIYRQFRARRQLKRYATTDSLTQLYNRGYAFNRGKQMIQEKQLERFSVIVFDIDNFKQINDSYGHPAGDQVLKSVGEICADCLRDQDLLSRIGGEEFMVILPGVDEQKATFIAQRLKQKLQAHQQQHEQYQFNVTASFGVAAIAQERNFEQLIKRADKALYQAKENGRNCVAVAP